MKEIGYGKDYIYSHNNPTDSQEFLPEKLIGRMFYKPKSNIKETSFKEALKKQWKGKYNY